MSRTNRLYPETVSIPLHIDGGCHDLAVCLAYDATGAVREVNFVSRGKIGHWIDSLLSELGIALSRAIQGRDPVTGEAP